MYVQRLSKANYPELPLIYPLIRYSQQGALRAVTE